MMVGAPRGPVQLSLRECRAVVGMLPSRESAAQHRVKTHGGKERTRQHTVAAGVMVGSDSPPWERVADGEARQKKQRSARS